MTIHITRVQVDKLFTFALLFNSVTAFFGVFAFFLSTWWIFLILGTIGFPFTITLILLYKYTKLREPMKKRIINLFAHLYESTIQRRGDLMKRIYATMCWFVPNQQWDHIAWGYAPLTPNGNLLTKLETEDEERKFYRQLYYYMATGINLVKTPYQAIVMGHWNTLESKNILEIRCGGGGGLSFLNKYLNPEKCIGVDVSTKYIEYCKQSYGENPKMKFHLINDYDKVSSISEIFNERMDLIISFQSSQCIKDFKGFTKEVINIMKPGGVFAFVDLKVKEDWIKIEKIFQEISLNIIKKQDITDNVVQALKLDGIAKWQLINRRIGTYLRSIFGKIGLIKESPLLESLSKGSYQAMAYILLKGSHSETKS